MTTGWLLLVTKPRQERWAETNVKRQGFNSYLPVVEIPVHGKPPRLDCLFPRYLFVRTSGPWRCLAGTFGVSHVVMQGTFPAILRENLIDELRAQENERGVIRLARKSEERFKPGELVRINGGIFSGYTGEYRLELGRDRVRVLLDYLGRKTTVDVDSDLVEALRNG